MNAAEREVANVSDVLTAQVVSRLIGSAPAGGVARPNEIVAREQKANSRYIPFSNTAPSSRLDFGRETRVRVYSILKATLPDEP